MGDADNGTVRLKGLCAGTLVSIPKDGGQPVRIEHIALLPDGVLLDGKDVGGWEIVPEGVVELKEVLAPNDSRGPRILVEAVVPSDAQLELLNKGESLRCSPIVMRRALEARRTLPEGTVYSRRLARLDGDVVTVANLQSVLECDRRTVYRMIRDGEVPAPRRLGRRYEWDKDVLVEWAEGL